MNSEATRQSIQRVFVWLMIAIYPKHHNFNQRQEASNLVSRSRNALIKFLLATSRRMNCFSAEESNNMFFKLEICLMVQSRRYLLLTKSGLGLHNLIAASRSQLGQEVLAYLIAQSNRGFFVEAGAADGYAFSNTRYLEEYFGWSGILCEPSKTLAMHLQHSSRRAAKDYRALHHRTGVELNFLENVKQPTLSTLESNFAHEADTSIEGELSRYTVSSITLLELLEDHAAPSYIDFLSLDTEGNEFDVLRVFDFSRYQFGLICVEYNSKERLAPIDALLTGHGYLRLSQLQGLSGGDAWFVSERSVTALAQKLSFFGECATSE